MKKQISLFIILFTTLTVNSQEIYSRTFGNSTDKPIVFLHGGPGYNSAVFEITTAKKLSENGFYVITYDRRGEGRSLDNEANFTFDEAFDDLNSLLKKYKLTSATLLGHSFGGVIASLYAEKYPDRATSVVLVGTPISMQRTLSTILNSSKEIYIKRNDSINLNYVRILENMDKKSIEYSSYCFSHAMQNGFYFPKEPSSEASTIYSLFKTDSSLLKYASQMTYEAPRGFWKNEQYTVIDLTNHIKNVIKKDVKLFGLYGKDDGLFSKEDIDQIKKSISKNNIEYLTNCSHNVFIDQQSLFIATLKRWIQ